MSLIASPARRRGAWRAVAYGVGGCAIAIVLALLAGTAGSEVLAGTTSTAAVAVIGPLGGLAGTTVASRRYRSQQLTSHDLALFWCAMTAVIVTSTYVYLSVDQASTATALITGAAGLRVMRIGLMERSAATPAKSFPEAPDRGGCEHIPESGLAGRQPHKNGKDERQWISEPSTSDSGRLVNDRSTTT